MAILALCDHFTSTVGTLGWWIAWLAGKINIIFLYLLLYQSTALFKYSLEAV
jgi:hypothetical protein